MQEKENNYVFSHVSWKWPQLKGHCCLVAKLDACSSVEFRRLVLVCPVQHGAGSGL